MSIYQERRLVVAVARLNSFARILVSAYLLLSSLAAQAKAPEVAPVSLPSCDLLSRGPAVNLQNQEVLLHSFLSDFFEELKSDRLEKIEKYFHPRAKRTKDLGEKLRVLLKNRYDTPWQFSVFRVWRIEIPNANKAILDSCPESGGASIIAQYGYKTQYMVWFQIMGQNELGRLMLSIAPDKGRLYATAFRLQQWSQQGEDWEAWEKKAIAAGKAEQKIPSYFAYDVAQKLLAGEDLVLYPKQRALQAERDLIVSQAELVKRLNEALKINRIAYIGSLLAKDGTGILIREVVETQEPTPELQERCLSRGKALIQLGWLTPGKTGLRCNYIFPGMSPDQDSPLGGFYLAPEDLTNTKK